MVRIKNHAPVVVTQKDADEYGSVESAVNGRLVEAEKVCNELNRIRLIEFNAIGFDFIEFNSISINQICTPRTGAKEESARGSDK